MDVGVRELKNNLSKYLACVGAGEEIRVTNHGRAIATISPIGTLRTRDRLIAEGILTPARSPKGPAPRNPVTATEPVSPLVAEQRR